LRHVSQSKSSAGRFFVALIGISALASGSGGIKLISDSYAGELGVSISFPNGQSSSEYEIDPNSIETFENATPGALNILLQAGSGSQCVLVCCDGNEAYEVYTNPSGFLNGLVPTLEYRV